MSRDDDLGWTGVRKAEADRGSARRVCVGQGLLITCWRNSLVPCGFKALGE